MRRRSAATADSWRDTRAARNACMRSARPRAPSPSSIATARPATVTVAYTSVGLPGPIERTATAIAPAVPAARDRTR